MANATFTAESAPTGVGPGTRWYQPSTGQWRTYNASTDQWEMAQDGFGSLKVANLAIANSLSAGDDPGITGTFEGAFKKVKIRNGIITEFELEG
jgi:hypothetical protein